ncbi:MAG: leucine zipper domain-containing protein [Proteobacteria bacterium]|nr:leucine zipper domain-containing protein [Pseudomonadota bacterium]
MTSVCRDFGISRKTGYKISNRYKASGVAGLKDRRRCPYYHANRPPPPDRAHYPAHQEGAPELG